MSLFFYGGYFDPPHKGHIEIIRQCLDLSNKFIIMPTQNSPLKKTSSSTDPKHILKMLNLLIQDIDQSIVIDDFDLIRSGPSYTVDTVRYLQNKYPKDTISMVVGADQLIQFEQWKDYLHILNSVHIIGFNRNNYDFTPLLQMNITWIKDFNMDISSEQIRKDIAKGRLNDQYVTASIKNYVCNNNLYG